jgi:hypothetical protein
LRFDERPSAAVRAAGERAHVSRKSLSPRIQLRAPHSEFASGNGSDQGILTLPSLELIRFRDGRVIWGAVILVGLCVLLAVLGWVEENRGLESLQVPEIWRIDRLPGES